MAAAAKCGTLGWSRVGPWCKRGVRVRVEVALVTKKPGWGELVRRG
jgi:hypothetical protein